MVKIKNANIWGRIGTGIGQGVSQALPEAVKRNQMSQGIKNIQQNNGATPLDQIGQLYQSGASMDQIAQILPYIERLQANRESQQLAQGISPHEQGIVNRQAKPNVSNIKSNQENVSSTVPEGGTTNINIEQPETPAKPRGSSIISKEAEQAALNPLAPLTTNQRRIRGAELQKQYPNLFPNREAGEQAAQQEWDDANAQQQQLAGLGDVQRATRGQLESETAKRLGLDLENPDVNAQVNKTYGTYYKELLDKADEEISSGKKTVTKASDDISRELKDFADARLNNETEGSKWFFKKDYKALQKSLDSNRKKYEKHDQLKTYKNDLIANHELSYPQAAYMTYPISKNKELNNTLVKNKPIRPELPLGTQYEQDKISKARDIADQTASLFKKGDSPIAAALELEEKGYSGLDYLNRLKEIDELHPFLNAEQREDFEHQDLTPSLGDWLMFGFTRAGKLPEVK